MHFWLFDSHLLSLTYATVLQDSIIIVLQTTNQLSYLEGSQLMYIQTYKYMNDHTIVTGHISHFILFKSKWIQKQFKIFG